MRIVAGLFVAALLLPAFAAHADESYTVITGGNPVGHLVASDDGGQVRIVYDYKNNGRGPTMAETIRIGANGLPVAWTIAGATTFGSKVNERFAQDGGNATWTDSVGNGSAKVGVPSLYIGQNGSPWSLGVYARALLADDDRSLPTLPAGSVTLTAGDELGVSGAGGALQVRSYAISGLDLNPSYFLLDHKQALFAVISPSAQHLLWERNLSSAQ